VLPRQQWLHKHIITLYIHCLACCTITLIFSYDKNLNFQSAFNLSLYMDKQICLILEYRQTNLMSLALLFHYLMLNMFRMLVHPSSGACDLFVELFHGLYCSGSMCVGVTVWFGWGGVVSLCRLKHCFIRIRSVPTCIRIPHHPSQTTT